MEDDIREQFATAIKISNFVSAYFGEPPRYLNKDRELGDGNPGRIYKQFMEELKRRRSQ